MQTLCTHRSVVRANVRGRRHTPLGAFQALSRDNTHRRERRKWQRLQRERGGWGVAEKEEEEEKKKEKKTSAVEIIQLRVEFSSDYFYTGLNLTACTLGEGHARRDGEVPPVRLRQMWSLSFCLVFFFISSPPFSHLLQFVSRTAAVFSSTRAPFFCSPHQHLACQ